MVSIRKRKKNCKTLYDNLMIKAMTRFSEKKYKLTSLRARKVRTEIIILMAHLLLNIKPVKDGENTGG